MLCDLTPRPHLLPLCEYPQKCEHKSDEQVFPGISKKETKAEYSGNNPTRPELE